MQKFSFLLVFTLLLSACSSSTSKAENAGYAMAETACMLFDESGSFDQITEKSTNIMNQYGWKDPAEIDAYLSSIQSNPEEKEEVKTATAEKLSSTCGDLLSTAGMTPTDFAESMISQ